jgi:hypothetical protein
MSVIKNQQKIPFHQEFNFSDFSLQIKIGPQTIQKSWLQADHLRKSLKSNPNKKPYCQPTWKQGQSMKKRVSYS